uniref:Protoporphyrinogen oxidase n=1 Tax=Chromera velia CCMP2878 TaxID=1169474 RepID=A0A0G4IF22_9ALVE|eukprot:Cvel_13840.t1-p1 / transcript=Cvel_13840.t1 / gene=Cvel_13840 / organism=Chromera_velia_CCMP2878 / gene_product=Protoporphyrinogen oxidase, chloroplastic, putative / transcript_product=Protoporphyrinogen oxidase, chloroplastic, putative / location=Cvel_scaffold961:35580-40750(+) / protein_length=566 / sequence_SO=supercontig / SO=protein_coding / is_pseudo=false
MRTFTTVLAPAAFCCCAEAFILTSPRHFSRSEQSVSSLQAGPSSASAAGTERTDALVIGAGLSGSSLAFNLMKNGVSDVTVIEANDRVGGNVISMKKDGFQWEEGPNTFQPNNEIVKLAADLGMADELRFADGGLPRWVFWDNVMHKLPGGPQDIPNFNLLSIPGKIRAALGAIGFVGPIPEKEETIREFVCRHLGIEVFEKLIDPFVSGVYAGDPSKLSIEACLPKIKRLESLGGPGLFDGGLLRMQELKKERAQSAADPNMPMVPKAALGSFKNGLRALCEAIAEKLGDRVKLSTRLVNLKPITDPALLAEGYRLRASLLSLNGGGEREVLAKSVAITTPAYRTADLVESMVPAAAALRTIEYPPVASVIMAYPSSSVAASQQPLSGFGHLIPRKNKIRTLGTIWVSSLFPERAPEGWTVLSSYIGGAQDVKIATLNPEQIAAEVDRDMRTTLLKVDAPKPKILGVRLWERAIPQYKLGHLEMLRRLEEDVSKVDGLFLGGNWKTGVAIGNCVAWGGEAASEICAFLDSLSSPSSSGSAAREAAGEMGGEETKRKEEEVVAVGA